MSSGRLGADEVVAFAGSLASFIVVIRTPLPGQRRASRSFRQPFASSCPASSQAPARQRETALEAPVRDLEPVDRCAARRTRRPPFSADDQLAGHQHQLDAVGRHAGQGDLDAHLVVARVHVGRRLPARPLRRTGGRNPEELAVHALRLFHEVHRIGPHPDSGIASLGHEDLPVRSVRWARSGGGSPGLNGAAWPGHGRAPSFVNSDLLNKTSVLGSLANKEGWIDDRRIRGLLFINGPADPYAPPVPRPDPDERFGADFYRRFYVDPKTRVVTRAEMARRADLLAAFVRHGELQVRSILDVGCGLGLMREQLLRHFPKPATPGLEVSEYLCAKHGWEQGSAATFRSERPFDLVVCYDVLQYLHVPRGRRRTAQPRPAVPRRAALRRADPGGLGPLLRQAADRPQRVDPAGHVVSPPAGARPSSTPGPGCSSAAARRCTSGNSTRSRSCDPAQSPRHLKGGRNRGQSRPGRRSATIRALRPALPVDPLMSLTSLRSLLPARPAAGQPSRAAAPTSSCCEDNDYQKAPSARGCRCRKASPAASASRRSCIPPAARIRRSSTRSRAASTNRRRTSAARPSRAEPAEEAVNAWAAAWADASQTRSSRCIRAVVPVAGPGGSSAFLDRARQQVATGTQPVAGAPGRRTSPRRRGPRVVTFVQRFGDRGVRKELTLVRETARAGASCPSERSTTP